jgi:dTDP-4-amino-4,6-dideoxygalactose transaminase
VTVPLSRPTLGEPEVEAARRAIMSGWVTQGPEVQAFEDEFATFVGARYACAVSSCTTALHLALRAAGVGPGDEVVTVSHSFIATANAVRYCGAVPVFADIESKTLNIDPESVVRAIGPRTRAILAVHQFGMPCDLERLIPIAREHRLPLIEDAACAAGTEIRWKGAWERIGKPHGDIACFSFHPRKVITTGDGGMITTSNADWDRRLRRWRQHGMSVSDLARHHTSKLSLESYDVLGYNYRMTDIQAAIGRVQLARLPAIVERRRALAARYRVLLSGTSRLELPVEPDWARSNWQSYCVRLADDVDPRRFRQSMLEMGVVTKSGIQCAHKQPAYATEPWSCRPGFLRCPCEGGVCARLPISELAESRTVLLPLFTDMTDRDLEDVASACMAAVGARVMV